MFPSDEEDVTSGQHHPDLSAITDAAASGCSMCKRLLQYTVSKSGTLEDCVMEPYEYNIYKYTYGAKVYLQSYICRDGERIGVYKSLLALSTSDSFQTFAVRNRQSIISLRDALRTAQKWMSDCLNGHEQCQKKVQPQTYPTRLLDLREDTIRIILPAESTISGPYAALSYCWGPNPTFLQLTAAKFPEFQVGIPYSDLPLAFQEAIDFTKRLSIQFLWIDSLCIIQSGPSSAQDWQSESAKMQDVYTNCVVNLALSRANNPHESCFSENPSSRSPVLSPTDIELIGTADGGDPETSKHRRTVLDNDYYHKALHDQPLGHRAWALQERLLPTRVLSFGLGELFWDCIQLPNASESFPRGLAVEDHVLHLPTRYIPSAAANSNHLEAVWYDIVEQYCNRELTFPEADKLAALSAIATRMGNVMDDVYIAGHFLKMLPLSLDWKLLSQHDFKNWRGKLARRLHTKSRKGGNHNEHGTIPTWSWASMDGALIPKPLGELWEATVEGYTLIPVDKSNPAGRLICANLKIKAHCAEIEWQKWEPTLLGKLGIPRDTDHALRVQIDDPDDQPTDGARQLLMSLTVRSEEFRGLIIKESETLADGERLYERVGHFRLHLKSRRQESLAEHPKDDKEKQRVREDAANLFTHGPTVITLS